MKRALIITYYWPPSGGAGVQRWLKLSKYLPEFGWQPVVYTPENPEAPMEDHSLLKDVHPSVEVIKRPIWEPYNLYKKFVGMKSEEKINAGFLQKQEKPQKKEGLSVWIRGNLMIPDSRKFWIRPSVKFLRQYLKKEPVDAIISTGPPHSMHIIALRLAKKLHIPWIADFRDPWTEIDFYDQLRLTRWADRSHRVMERKVLTGADKVVVIGKTMAQRLQESHGISPVVIPNGFDEADFESTALATDLDEKGQSGHTGSPGLFTIVHVGAMNKDRNHPVFWEAMSELLSEDPLLRESLRIKLVGNVDMAVNQDIARHKLEELVEQVESMSHESVIPVLKSATILYLPINNTPNATSIQTGKLFEYLAAGRPILGIGPENGDAADIIHACNAGKMTGFDDKAGLKSVLKEYIALSKENSLLPNSSGTDQFTRKNLAKMISEQLNEQFP